MLEKTSATIYCLVRASSEKKAYAKILDKLNKYQLCTPHHSRIIPILGDLSGEKLGLSGDHYAELNHKVDAIYHVGANVHHMFDYQTLYHANVQSLREMLQMAVTSKNKALHFISTLAAQFISPLEDAASQLNLNGYLTSKWVAEQLVKEAHARGVAAYTYRPGNIIAGSNAIYEPEMNHTFIKTKRHVAT